MLKFQYIIYERFEIMKKILILYAKYGGGHSSAANAIKNYIDNHYRDAETNIVDCIEYINKAINKISVDTYKKITSTTPRLWKTVYYHSEKGLLSQISRGSNIFMAKKLYHLIKDYSPDLIISTHMFATQMVSYMKRKGKINCTLATVLTDFAPHEQWLIGRDYGDYFFVAHEKMRECLINDFGIDKSKVFATGIPLSEKFQQNFDKAAIYQQFGLKPELRTILFFAGGEFGLGKEKTISVFNSLIKHLDTYQIIAISGKNPKMFEHFRDISQSLGNPSGLKIFDYITNVPEAMCISDLVVTKPGGLTSSESLASSLPMIIINPIPGQEEENAEFIEQAGAGIWIRPTDDVELIISNILKSEKTIEEMREKAHKIAHLNATHDICEVLLNDSL